MLLKNSLEGSLARFAKHFVFLILISAGLVLKAAPPIAFKADLEPLEGEVGKPQNLSIVVQSKIPIENFQVVPPSSEDWEIELVSNQIKIPKKNKSEIVYEAVAQYRCIPQNDLVEILPSFQMYINAFRANTKVRQIRVRPSERPVWPSLQRKADLQESNDKNLLKDAAEPTMDTTKNETTAVAANKAPETVPAHNLNAGKSAKASLSSAAGDPAPPDYSAQLLAFAEPSEVFVGMLDYLV